jgi:hypothetical protein
LPGWQNEKPRAGPNACCGYPLLDPVALRALAGQVEGFDEFAFTAYRHA